MRDSVQSVGPGPAMYRNIADHAPPVPQLNVSGGPCIVSLDQISGSRLAVIMPRLERDPLRLFHAGGHHLMWSHGLVRTDDALLVGLLWLRAIAPPAFGIEK